MASRQIKTNDAIFCPITMEVFDEPVIDNEGNTYEKNAIEKWMIDNDNSSPLTRNIITSLVPNRSLKSSIEWFVETGASINVSSDEDYDDLMVDHNVLIKSHIALRKSTDEHADNERLRFQEQEEILSECTKAFETKIQKKRQRIQELIRHVKFEQVQLAHSQAQVVLWRTKFYTCSDELLTCGKKLKEREFRIIRQEVDTCKKLKECEMLFQRQEADMCKKFEEREALFRRQEEERKTLYCKRLIDHYSEMTNQFLELIETPSALITTAPTTSTQLEDFNQFLGSIETPSALITTAPTTSTQLEYFNGMTEEDMDDDLW